MPFKPLTSTILLSLLLIFILSIALPFAVYAAESTGLVTCGLMSSKTLCNICDLVILFQILVNKANSYFALPLAALMLGYGGFLMVLSGFQGGNAGLYTKGKKVLTNTLIGIIIIFCSWLAIDTLLKTVGAYQHNTTGNFGPWNVIECVSPDIKLPTHFECKDQQCIEVEGVTGGFACTTDRNSRSCREHFECENESCVSKPTEGFDTCEGKEDKTTCKVAKPGDMCAGVQCEDSGIDTYQPDPRADCTIKGDWDKAIDWAFIRAGSIGSDIDTKKMVRAIMATESHGKISSVSKAGACGLMQIVPGTGKAFATMCGADFNEASTCDFYTNPANAAKSICIAIGVMNSLFRNCGKDIRNIAAAYNGDDACSPSVHCGSHAGPGECKVNANQTGETKRWECLWDDAAHTTCNAKKQGGNFLETRKYVPKVLKCYN